MFPEVLSREKVGSPGPWMAHLGCQEALQIIRRVRIGDEFYVHSTFWVDPLRVPVFATMPLRQMAGENFKHLIFRACGQAIHKVDLFTRQEVRPREVSGLLNMPARQLCSSLRVQAFMGKSDPICYQQIFTPPNICELHIVSDSRAPGFSL